MNKNNAMKLPTPNYQTLFEAVPGHYLVLLSDFRIVAVSDAYLRATMTKREEILGRDVFEVFPDNPDDPNATGTSNLRASLNRVLKGRITDVMAVQKYDILDPNSPEGKFEERHWAPSNSPVLDQKGAVQYIIHRVEDVTEFVNLRKREKKTADQFRSRVSTSGPAGAKSTEQELNSIIQILDESAILAITDRTGNIIHANQKFCEISKYSREELLGKNHRILNSGHHPKQFFTEMWKTISSGKFWDGEIKNRAKDGTCYWVHTAISPILDDRGQPDQYVAVRYEITQKKLAEEMLNQTEAQVIQLQKMDAIGRLAGGVAHDFNNLLGAITMYCDLLADDPGDRSAVESNVRDIKETADRGAALTRQLLIFSRKQVVQLVPTDLNRLVSNLRNMLTRLIGENIELVAKLESDLKLVKADPGQIEQVITNLVVNARDAMPKGGRVVIETSNTYVNEDFSNTHLTVTPGHYVVMSVGDSGLGMDAATQSKLFEPFFTTKPMGKGTGLGLTTVYGIIKHCGGTI
jgi:PAS domain S-box-containing protein